MAYVAEGRATIDLSASGDNTVITGVTGATIEILSIVLYVNVTTTVILKDGSTAINGAGFLMPSQAGWDKDFPADRPLKLTSGSSFVINLGAAVSVTGWVEYRQR